MQAIRDGGWGMIPTLIFGLVMLAAATRYGLSPERRWVPLLVSLGALTLSAGGLGFVTGLLATARYVAQGEFTGPGERVAVSFMGFGESLNNVAFALAFVALSTLAVVIGAFRKARSPAPAEIAA